MFQTTRQLAYGMQLTAQAAVSTSGNSQATPVFLRVNPNGGIVFEFDITAVAAASGDTLDLTVQTLVDGTNWVDVAHCTQVLGNGTAKRYYAKISAVATEGMFDNASGLSAGTVRNILGDQFAVKWAVVDGGAHGQLFSFSVTAMPM